MQFSFISLTFDAIKSHLNDDQSDFIGQWPKKKSDRS